jgi:ABC-type nitrate/sulfonate/bicarbonate transport system substrate-binding protein
MHKYATIGLIGTVVAIGLTGCASSTPSADGSPAPLRIAYASDLDPNDIADQFGIQAAGAESTALTEDSAVTAGLQNGNYDLGNIDITAAIKAIQAGLPLKIVYVSQNLPEFVMVSQSDITDLAGLEGKTVAYHSAGSLTEILEKELVAQNVPDLDSTINWTVLPESPNRAAAMVADRIDATTLEYLDVLALQQQGDFNVLGSWADLTGPSGDAIATVWVATDSFISAHRDQLVDFLTDVQDGYDKTYADKDAWIALAQELLPDVELADLEDVYAYYTGADMYPQSGVAPISEERWAGLNDFFQQIGEYDESASIDMVDLDIVGEVNGP